MAMVKLIILAITVSLLLLLWSRPTNSAEGKCSSRTEHDSRCKKKCTKDEHCIGRKKQRRRRRKKCLCDGVCGMSCIRVDLKCGKEPTNKLRRGIIKLNGKSYDRNANFKFGSVVTYKCKKGYTLFGPSEVRCSGIGKWKPWDKGTPKCKRSCGDPGSLRDGKRVGNSFEVRKTVRFRCNPGYRLNGSSSITCLPSLKWNDNVPKCEVLKCDAPVLPVNGRIMRGRQLFYQYGDRVYLSCLSGYYRRGGALYVCELDGWVIKGGSKTQCYPKSCGTPGYLRNGNKEGTRYTFKNVVKFSCHFGYELKGSRYRRCQANQKWSGVLPTCERVDCGVPEELQNGNYNDFGTKFGQKQYIVCDTGYKADGPTQIICGGDKKWSHNTRCKIVTCEASYVTVDHGQVTGTDGGSSCTNIYNCKLEYHCSQGYYVSPKEYKTPICQDNGLWTDAPPKCRPVDCRYPGEPLYGYIASSKSYTFPNIVEYKCNINYVLSGGSGKRNCQANGIWSGTMPECRANCGNPGQLQNGRISGSIFMAYASISFECKLGYYLSARYKQSFCKQDTARWTPSVPICILMSCGNPGKLDKGVIHGWKYTYKSVVTFSCNPGYDLIGNTQSECQADGRWSRENPICRANCGHPGLLENGIITGNVFVASSKVRYGCNYGYELDPVVKSSECIQRDAKWFPAVPRCQLVSCGNPGKLDKGVIRGWKYTYNSVVTFSCNPEYDLIGNNQSECQADGRWSRENPICRANCGHPGLLENGNMTGDVFVASSIVRYTCNYGYELDPVVRSSECIQRDAKWFPGAPRCQVMSCGNPGKLDKGVIHGPKYTYKSVVTFSCNPEYDLIGNNQSECQADGRWSRENPICRANCGHPGQLENGKVIGDVFTANSQVKYECNDGYYLHPDVQVSKCMQRNARWSMAVPKCRRVSCENPGNLQNGIVDGSNYIYRSVLRFACTDGYKLIGDNSTECQSNGQWTNKIPKCQGLLCKDHVVPLFGSVRSKDFRYPNSAFFRCNEGYKIEGQNSIRCQINGSWSGKFPICKVVDCGEPRVNHGIFTGNTKYNEHIIVKCNEGYTVHGNNMSICRADGSWESLPKCEDKSYIGCYKDGRNRVMRDSISQSTTSINQCISLCQNAGKYYAGIEGGYDCRCGNVYHAHGKAKESECYIPCSADRKTYCGGDWRMSVYKTGCTEPWPLAITNGNPKKKLYRVGDTAEYDCTRGHVLKGEFPACQRNLRWSIKKPRCEKVTCGSLPYISNGNIEGRGYTYGTRRSIRCNRGYKINMEPPTIQCNERGRWTGTEKKCIIVEIPTTTRLPATTPQPTTPHPTTLQPTTTRPRDCKDSIFGCYSYRKYCHKPAGSSWGKWLRERCRKTCNFCGTDCNDSIRGCNIHLKYCQQPADSQWEKWLRNRCRNTCNFCAGSSCVTPDPPAFGKIIPSVYQERKHALFTCNPGYKPLNRSSRLTCKERHWVGTKMSCVKDDRYIGCYKGIKNDKWASSVIFQGPKSINECISLCKGRLYRNAGVQYGGKCICSSISRLHYLKVDDSGCSMVPCKKDSTMFCGASYRMVVYRTIPQ